MNVTTTETADTGTVSRMQLADKIAMVVGGGLILLGTTVMGIFESFFTGHTVSPNGNLGDVVIHTSFDPTLRAYAIALGLLVLFLYGLFRFANRQQWSGQKSGGDEVATPE